MDIDARCRREIIELHEFFEAWLCGRVPRNDKTLARLRNVLAERFEVINPAGARLTKGMLLGLVRAGYGSRADDDPPFTLRVGNIRTRPLAAGVYVATYQESQRSGADIRMRLSTAVFRLQPRAPNGVQWEHLHEVWVSTPSG